MRRQDDVPLKGFAPVGSGRAAGRWFLKEIEGRMKTKHSRVSPIGFEEAMFLAGDPEYLPPIDLDEIASGCTRSRAATPRGGEDDFLATLAELDQPPAAMHIMAVRVIALIALGEATLLWLLLH